MNWKSLLIVPVFFTVLASAYSFNDGGQAASGENLSLVKETPVGVSLANDNFREWREHRRERRENRRERREHRRERREHRREHRRIT